MEECDISEFLWELFPLEHILLFLLYSLYFLTDLIETISVHCTALDTHCNLFEKTHLCVDFNQIWILHIIRICGGCIYFGYGNQNSQWPFVTLLHFSSWICSHVHQLCNSIRSVWYKLHHKISAICSYISPIAIITHSYI